MTRNPKSIVSPMPWGSGAYVVHRILERHLSRYRVVSYHPYWTLLPFLLRTLAPVRSAGLIHTVADYAICFYRKSMPLVITFQNYVLDPWMRSYSSLAQRIHYATDLRLLTRLATGKATSITAVSQFTARLVKKDLGLSRPIKVIYNGVDVNHFTPASPQRSTHKDVRVFFSGNLTSRKGVPWLPSIARRLNKNVRIYYTQGLRTRRVLSQAENLEPVGPVPFEEMPARYRQMDILLMPTVREGLSLAVLEAMATGLPVVASRCSSLPEQIDQGKGGFLCPVGDTESFAESINTLADSARLRQEMGEYNRAKVERLFTVERMVNSYQALFEEILSK